MSDLSKIIGRDFDKKKEIPQVKLDLPKIPNLEKGGYADDGIFIEQNPFSQLESITKEIHDKQESEIAMDFTKNIASILKRHKVQPVIYRVNDKKNGGTIFEYEYGISVADLDFTEHDEVFVDKISKLEKQIEEEQCQLCFKYHVNEIERSQNDALRNEYEKLKQRISELEEKNKNLASMVNELQLEKVHLKDKISELEIKKNADLPFDPMETANYLINATYERETNGIERSFAKLQDKISEDKYSIDDLEQIAEHLLIYCKHNKEVEE